MTTIKKYNKSEIMRNAWVIFRNNNENLTFGQSLSQSWNLAKNGLKAISFDAIYKKYYNQVYFYIMDKVNFKAYIAEELTNDVFLKAKRYLENYDAQRAKLNTWLIFIAKNLVIDNSRTSHNDKFVNVSNFVDAETGKETFQIVDNSQVDMLENKQLIETINKAMQSLKPKYKAIAELYFIHEKNYNEIAEILNVPLGTVKGTLARARAMLQTQLKEAREMV